MRKFVLPILICSLSACAVIEDKELDVHTAFNPIESQTNVGNVEHGVVTVRQLNPRSDIIVLAPSVQHVVWRRDDTELPVASVSQTQTKRTVDRFEQVNSSRDPRVRDNWPLLEEDMNFDTEIGRVDMCYPTTPCEPGDSCGGLVPCTDPDRYDCFTTKPGEYCLEKAL